KMMDRELGKAIDLAVAGLPDDYRTVFLLKDVDGLSNEEIADALELTVPAVKSRLHRARLALRKNLASSSENDRIGIQAGASFPRGPVTVGFPHFHPPFRTERWPIPSSTAPIASNSSASTSTGPSRRSAPRRWRRPSPSARRASRSCGPTRRPAPCVGTSW